MAENTLPKTISFSALTDFQYCPKYYKLVHIDKLKKWSNTPDTIFGTYIHEAVQDVCQKNKTAEEAVKLFERRWKTLCKIYKKYIPENKVAYGLVASKIITQIVPELEKEFGKFVVLAVEAKLDLPNGSKWPQSFKGYIDIVLQLENGTIVIADFKTSDSAFMFNEHMDSKKQYQLTLYKKYYSIMHNIEDQKTIETYFIVLEKNPKSKKPIHIMRVTSGPKKIQNATEWLEFCLSAINRRVFICNRMNCLKYGEGHPCLFYKTENCK